MFKQQLHKLKVFEIQIPSWQNFFFQMLNIYEKKPSFKGYNRSKRRTTQNSIITKQNKLKNKGFLKHDAQFWNPTQP